MFPFLRIKVSYVEITSVISFICCGLLSATHPSAQFSFNSLRKYLEQGIEPQCLSYKSAHQFYLTSLRKEIFVAVLPICFCWSGENLGKIMLVII
jgi:hypothetical protein